MRPTAYAHSIVIAVHVSLGTGLLPGQGPAQGPATESATAAKGVHCPREFETVFDPATKVLTCRREVVSWVVTSCPEKDFAKYVAKVGPDSCGPTEIPGVGTPPGATRSRPVGCAAPGYSVVVDRTGPRDRCERVERSFALPRPVP
jgi:hypothetical protein